MRIWNKYLKKVVGKDFTKNKRPKSSQARREEPRISFGHLLSDFFSISATIMRVDSSVFKCYHPPLHPHRHGGFSCHPGPLLEPRSVFLTAKYDQEEQHNSNVQGRLYDLSRVLL